VKIYLDSCAIQRPLDSFTNTRLSLEAEAVLGILHLCEIGKIELVSSEALEYEMDQNQLAIRQEHAKAVLAKAKHKARVDEEVEQRADEFAKHNIKPLDALHLALAEASQAEYFCTCDDRLLAAVKKIQVLNTRPISPIELIEEIEG